MFAYYTENVNVNTLDSQLRKVCTAAVRAPHAAAHPTLRMFFGVSVYTSGASVLPADMGVRLSSD